MENLELIRGSYEEYADHFNFEAILPPGVSIIHDQTLGLHENADERLGDFLRGVGQIAVTLQDMLTCPSGVIVPRLSAEMIGMTVQARSVTLEDTAALISSYEGVIVDIKRADEIHMLAILPFVHERSVAQAHQEEKQRRRNQLLKELTEAIEASGIPKSNWAGRRQVADKLMSEKAMPSPEGPDGIRERYVVASNAPDRLASALVALRLSLPAERVA